MAHQAIKVDSCTHPSSYYHLCPHPPHPHSCFHSHFLLPSATIPFSSSNPYNSTLDSSVSDLSACSSAPSRTGVASGSPPQRGTASNTVSGDIPSSCVPMSISKGEICQGIITPIRPDNVVHPIASTADAPSAAFLRATPPAPRSLPFFMPASCHIPGHHSHGWCFPKFMPCPISYPCRHCGMWNYYYYPPYYPYYTKPILPHGLSGCQHGDLQQLRVDTETCPTDELPNRKMVDTCKKKNEESIGTILADGVPCESSHEYIGAQQRELCHLQVDKDKACTHELPDRCEAEEQEEAEDGLQLVLTDEWMEFFAKSEARRQERKRQQKKDVKAARRASKSVVKDQAV